MSTKFSSTDFRMKHFIVTAVISAFQRAKSIVGHRNDVANSFQAIVKLENNVDVLQKQLNVE